MVDLPSETTVHQAPLEGLGWAGSAPGDAAVTADLARLDAAAGDLDALEAVLARLDRDEDGTCEVCGAALDPEVVARQPLVRACAAH